MALRRAIIALDILWDDEKDSGMGLKQDHPALWDYRELLDLSPDESVSVSQVVNVEKMADSEYHIIEGD